MKRDLKLVKKIKAAETLPPDTGSKRRELTDLYLIYSIDENPAERKGRIIKLESNGQCETIAEPLDNPAIL